MTDKIRGGLSDGIPPSAFPKKKVQQGAKVELEHTGSKALAKEIARDHLTEDMNYYTKLKKMEKTAMFETTIEAFVDELEKISALNPYLVGSALGAGVGAITAGEGNRLGGALGGAVAAPALMHGARYAHHLGKHLGAAGKGAGIKGVGEAANLAKDTAGRAKLKDVAKKGYEAAKATKLSPMQFT